MSLAWIVMSSWNYIELPIAQHDKARKPLIQLSCRSRISPCPKGLAGHILVSFLIDVSFFFLERETKKSSHSLSKASKIDFICWGTKIMLPKLILTVTLFYVIWVGSYTHTCMYLYVCVWLESVNINLYTFWEWTKLMQVGRFLIQFLFWTF